MHSLTLKLSAPSKTTASTLTNSGTSWTGGKQDLRTCGEVTLTRRK